MDSAALGCPVRWASAAAMCSCQMAAIPPRASMDKASCSVRVLCGATLAGLSRLSLTIDLISGRAQTGNAIPIHVTFPGQKLFERERVNSADLIERQPASAHRLDHGRLAPHRPPFPYRWQLGHLLECIIRAILARGRIAWDLRFHVGFPPISGNLSRLTLQI